jgi:pimeloyl-ACP methyl ester carboxylesterase
MRIKLYLPLFILLFGIGCSSATFDYHVATSDSSNDFVIILHGLRGKSASFVKLEQALLEQGLNVCRIDYPSKDDSIQALANTAISAAMMRCERAGSDTLFFIAHSMGAILLRYYLQEHDVPKLAGVVLLSPPNHGIELIDAFEWSRLFRQFNGPAGMQLSAKENAFIQSLEKPDYAVGVIMSKKSINPIASAFIPGKDDGRVSIESAKLDGMTDFVLVNSNHHVVMKKQETIDHIIAFIKTGRFDR